MIVNVPSDVITVISLSSIIYCGRSFMWLFSCSCYRPLFLSLPLLSSLLLSLCWPLVLSFLSPLLSPLSLSLLSLHCCRGVCTYSLRQQKRHLDFCRVYPTQTSVGDHDLQFGGYAYLIYRSQTWNDEVSWSVGMFNMFFYGIQPIRRTIKPGKSQTSSDSHDRATVHLAGDQWRCSTLWWCGLWPAGELWHAVAGESQILSNLSIPKRRTWAR